MRRAAGAWSRDWLAGVRAGVDFADEKLVDRMPVPTIGFEPNLNIAARKIPCASPPTYAVQADTLETSIQLIIAELQVRWIETKRGQPLIQESDTTGRALKHHWHITHVPIDIPPKSFRLVAAVGARRA